MIDITLKSKIGEKTFYIKRLEAKSIFHDYKKSTLMIEISNEDCIRLFLDQSDLFSISFKQKDNPRDVDFPNCYLAFLPESSDSGRSKFFTFSYGEKK